MQHKILWALQVVLVFILPGALLLPNSTALTAQDAPADYWEEVSTVPVTSLTTLTVDPTNPDRLYARGSSAAHLAALRSDDGGSHWISASTGLGAYPYWQLAIGMGAGTTGYAWRANDTAIFRRIMAMTPSVDVTPTLTLNDKRMTVAPRDGSTTTVTLDTAPLLGTGNRTLVPLRAIAEAFGVTVTWDATAHTATITGATNTLTLTIGKATAVVNGRDTLIDTDAKVVPILVAGRMLLPVRFVAESLGATVTYNQATKVIAMTYIAY